MLFLILKYKLIWIYVSIFRISILLKLVMSFHIKLSTLEVNRKICKPSKKKKNQTFFSARNLFWNPSSTRTPGRNVYCNTRLLLVIHCLAKRSVEKLSFLERRFYPSNTHNHKHFSLLNHHVFFKRFFPNWMPVFPSSEKRT